MVWGVGCSVLDVGFRERNNNETLRIGDLRFREGVEVKLPLVGADESVERTHERPIASQLLPVPAARRVVLSAGE